MIQNATIRVQIKARPLILQSVRNLGIKKGLENQALKVLFL